MIKYPFEKELKSSNERLFSYIKNTRRIERAFVSAKLISFENWHNLKFSVLHLIGFYKWSAKKEIEPIY